jgi:vacuolar-type H+-ATPase subunit I/STV1
MKTAPTNASNAAARVTIRADIAAKVMRGAKVNKVLYGLSDEQLVALMAGVTDAEVEAINELTAARAIGRKLPYAGKVMEQILDAVGPGSYTALMARLRALALTRKALGNSGHLVARTNVAMSGYIVGLVFPEAFSPAQYITVTFPFTRTLGDLVDR